jgi:hypothetical protein
MDQFDDLSAGAEQDVVNNMLGRSDLTVAIVPSQFG